MPDGYLISVGVKADLSELKQESTAAAETVKEMASEISGSLTEANAAAETSGEAFQAMAEAYAQAEAEGLKTVETMSSLTAAAAEQSAAVSQAAAAELQAAMDTTESMSAQALAMGRLKAAYEDMARLSLEAANSQSRVSGVLQQYRQNALGAGVATQLLSVELQENAAATVALSAAKAEAIAAQMTLTEVEQRATVATEEHAVASAEAATAEREEAVAATEASESTGHLTTRLYAAQGAARLLEGGLPLRAFERLISMSSLVGSALEMAFPLIGAVALIEIVGRGIEKLREMAHAAGETTERIKRDWLDANDAIMRSNDQLQASTDREIESANKLLGKRADNTLTEAFDDARQSADKLGESIDSDLKKFDELIKKKADTVGFWGGLVSGAATTGDSQKMLAGVEQKIRSVTEEHSEVVNRAGESGNKENLQQAEEARIVALQKVYATATKEIETHLSTLRGAQEAYEASGKNFGKDQTANINLLSGALRNLSEQQRTIGLDYANGQAKQDQLKAKDSKGDSDAGRKADEARMRADEVAYNQLRSSHAATLKEEAQFWEERLANYSRTSSQYESITGKLAQIYIKGAEEAHRAIDKMRKEQEQKVDPPSGHDETARMLKQEADDLFKTGDSWREYRSEVLSTTLTQIEEAAKLAEARVQLQLATGAITAQGAAHAQAAIHAKEYADKLLVLNDELERIKTDGGLSPKNQVDDAAKLNKQISQTQGQRQIAGIADQTKEAQLFEKPWTKAFDEVGRQWMQVQDRILLGQLSISRGAQQMASKMLLDIIHANEQMLLNTLRRHILEATSASASQALQTSAAVAGTSSRDAVEMRANIKSVFGAAKAGAAKAYQAMAGIPIIGPELGAIAAAATFAGIMAVGAFERGGIIPGSVGSAVPIIGHAGEAVLPQPMTKLLMRAATSGGGGAGMSMTNNNTFNGVADKKTFQKMLNKHQRDVASVTRKALRNGR